jgi:pullulanase/glycogen debranching enzyme
MGVASILRSSREKAARALARELHAIRALRERQKRNFMTTLFLSQDVPMISGGDELSRTQRGNNNARPRTTPS